jgi:chitinase
MSNSLSFKLNGKRPLGVYFQTWSSRWSSNSSTTDLAQINAPINLVYLSFVQPNCTYIAGSNSWTGTGLEFSSEFSVIQGAINILKQKGMVVMLSVGGASYSWNNYNTSALAALVNDLDCDGIDIDWEDPAGAIAAYKLGPIIAELRNALPNKSLSLAGFSVGAYGSGEFINAQPPSSNTGMCISGLQSNGNQLDWINIMSYDASPVYSPTQAFDAYRKYFSGPLLIGCEVPPEAWGGNVITLSQVTTYAKYTLQDTQCNGIFVWSYQKSGTPSSSDIISTAAQILSNPTITTIIPESAISSVPIPGPASVPLSPPAPIAGPAPVIPSQLSPPSSPPSLPPSLSPSLPPSKTVTDTPPSSNNSNMVYLYIIIGLLGGIIILFIIYYLINQRLEIIEE